jgi:hypothetical protein
MLLDSSSGVRKKETSEQTEQTDIMVKITIGSAGGFDGIYFPICHNANFNTREICLTPVLLVEACSMRAMSYEI